MWVESSGVKHSLYSNSQNSPYFDAPSFWELKPTKVKIRAYGKQIEYLRSLPLHRSQKEGASKYGEFCEFEYKLCLTPELSTHILAMGENVEVLEPIELRDEIKRRLKECQEVIEELKKEGI